MILFLLLTGELGRLRLPLDARYAVSAGELFDDITYTALFGLE